MAQAKVGDKVKVHYTGRFDNGQIFDSSENRNPLEFTIGQGQVVPGFENAVIGMNPGDSKTERIDAENAYGPYVDEMVITVNRSQIPQDMNPEVGQELEVRSPEGDVIPVMVTDVTEETITLDANHPLAGQALTFDIKLVEIA